jgi:hypothetical protein
VSGHMAVIGRNGRHNPQLAVLPLVPNEFIAHLIPGLSHLWSGSTRPHEGGRYSAPGAGRYAPSGSHLPSRRRLGSVARDRAR